MSSTKENQEIKKHESLLLLLVSSCYPFGKKKKKKKNPRVFTNNKKNNKNTNINKRSKQKPHKARDQNKNHEHPKRSKTQTRSNKPTNLTINPRTQAWTKPTNPDFPNPNPLTWTEPRQQRLQVKDLCKGFLLPQVKVLFSFVSLFFFFFWCKVGRDSSSIPPHEN